MTDSDPTPAPRPTVVKTVRNGPLHLRIGFASDDRAPCETSGTEGAA